MAEPILMSRSLTEEQEKVVQSYIIKIKEIEVKLRAWSNVHRDNQFMIDECNEFISLLRGSRDILKLSIEDVTYHLFDIIKPAGFPEIHKILVTGIMNVLAEDDGEQSEVDKTVSHMRDWYGEIDIILGAMTSDI